MSGGENLSSAQLCQLDSSETYAPGSRVDQNAISSFHAGEPVQGVICGRERHCNACSIHKVQMLRDFPHSGEGYGDVGIEAARCRAEGAIANLEFRDVFTDGSDFAGKFDPE